MRRLWSYIILTVTSLVLMGATFVNVFGNTHSNVEYQDGREMVFRVSDKDGEELPQEGETVDGKTPAENIASAMISRLEKCDISHYRVTTLGYDTVSVNLRQDTTANYNNIQTLLAFNGSLALSSKLNDFLVEGEEHFLDGDAYLETVNDYPSINIPVGNNFYDLLKIVKQYKDEGKTEAAESQTSGEGEEAETTYTYHMYLWHDYVDGNTFEQTVSGNDEYDAKVAEKIFMNFDVEQIEDDAKKITAYVNISDKNGNEKYEASEVAAAFDTARFYVNLINSGALDYKVTFLYDTVSPSWTEELLTVDGIVKWSNTLKATICAVVILSLLLVVFYRLGTLSAMSSGIGSVFFSIGAIVLFNAEFNVAGLIALIAVATVSMISSVIYLTKLKEESYRGRSLKKANSEAAKKALLPTIDVHVALIAIGVFCYIFGGNLMRCFSVITVLGGLASLILSLVWTRLTMWLATNTTKLQGKYDKFGIESERVPNLIKEEKQTYFGPYADKDMTKRKGLVGILVSLVFVAGLAGTIIFGAMNKGVVYNNGSTNLETQIFFETETENTLLTENKVKDLLKNTYVYAEGKEDKATPFADKINEITYKTREDTVENSEDVIHFTYYVVSLKESFDASKFNAYYVEKGPDGQEIGTRVYAEDGISVLLENKMKEVDTDVKVDIKLNTIQSSYQPEYWPILWGTLVGIAVTGLYLILRYRLSRGLASMLLPIATSVGVAGIFALVRAPVTSYAAVVMPVIAVLTFVLEIIFMNRERELVIEDKTRDNSPENREKIMKRASALAFGPMMVGGVLALYLGINFFGFGANGNAWLFLIFTVAMLFILFTIAVIIGPLSHFFFKLFHKMNMGGFFSKFRRKKKKAKTTNNKSAEPEEYVFIGINE